MPPPVARSVGNDEGDHRAKLLGKQYLRLQCHTLHGMSTSAWGVHQTPWRLPPTFSSSHTASFSAGSSGADPSLARLHQAGRHLD